MNFIRLWWRSLNKYTIVSVLLLISIGLILVTTSSPVIANRVGVKEFYFINKQILYLSFSIGIIVILSILDLSSLKKICLISFLFFLILMILVPIFGYETKGGKRWLSFGIISIQPSELIKPLFAVVIGWIMSLKNIKKIFTITSVTTLYIIIAYFLIKQPDIGMFILLSMSFIGQLFITGLPLIFGILFFTISFISLIICYLWLPHVAERIDGFLNNSSMSYQVEKAVGAFHNGGFYGVGPGEGKIKQFIPDSHTDFIFAVAGEEFGGIFCIIITAIFFFIVIYNFYIIIGQQNSFIIFVGSGILIQFALQSIINMGVSLYILPTKGMTLPLISYGGSSLLAVSISIGVLLSITKKDFKIITYKLNLKKYYDLCL